MPAGFGHTAACYHAFVVEAVCAALTGTGNIGPAVAELPQESPCVTVGVENEFHGLTQESCLILFAPAHFGVVAGDGFGADFADDEGLITVLRS